MSVNANTYEIQAGSILAQFRVQLKKTDTNGPGTTGIYDASGSGGKFSASITDGTGNNQINDLAVMRISIADGATEAVDLTGSTYFNVFNVALTWAKLKFVMIEAAATNTTNVTPGGGGTPVIASAPAITPSGAFFYANPISGLTVAAGSTDLLNLVNGAGAAAVVDVLLGGVKA